MWHFLEERGSIKVVSGSTTLTVTKIEKHDMENMIQVHGDDEAHQFDLRQFDGSQNSFNEKLQKWTKSRTLFVKGFQHLQAETSNRTKDNAEAEDPVEKSVTDRSKQDCSNSGTKAKKKSAKKQNTDKVTRTSRYQSEIKVIGDCVDVHLSKLREPGPERLTRQVDPEHVSFLTEEFRRNETQFVVLAGTVPREWNGDVSLLADADSDVEVETIGGNHSRIALQYLMESGHLTQETVKMRLYRNLTDDEALEIGVAHNDQARKSKQMTFMDKARLIRSRLQGSDPDNILAEKRKLSKIFDQKNVTDFNHNFKAHLSLTKRATETIWGKVSQLEHLWFEGKIRGVKKGKEMKQTIVHNLYSRNLHDEDREKLLDTLMANGLSAYKKQMDELVEKNDKEDNDEIDRIESLELVQTDDEVVGDSQLEVVEERDLVEQEEESSTTNSLEQTMRTTTERERLLTEENRQLREENDRLKKRNEELEKLVEEFKRKETKQVEDQDVFVSQLSLTKKRPLEAAVDSENTVPRKRKPVVMVEGFSVGENVKAVWSGDGQAYDAVILSKHQNGVYTVKYNADGIVERRSKKFIRPAF